MPTWLLYMMQDNAMQGESFVFVYRSQVPAVVMDTLEAFGFEVTECPLYLTEQVMTPTIHRARNRRHDYYHYHRPGADRWRGIPEDTRYCISWQDAFRVVALSQKEDGKEEDEED